MQIARSIAEVRLVVRNWRRLGLRVGYVPTMGALHAGHLALAHQSRAECERTVVGVFVNPTQFGPNEDFDRYPRTEAEDTALLRAAGADLLYLGMADEIYPQQGLLSIKIKQLDALWEGAIRGEGHFEGVALVVAKLLNIVQPDVLYLGRKDFQQTVVLRRLVSELFLPVEVRIGETVREADGLPMSSRNRYLNPEERAKAGLVYQALHAVAAAKAQGLTVDQAVEQGRALVASEPAFRLDYLQVVDEWTLEPLAQWKADGEQVALIAAKLGSTRLLDNLLL